MYQTLSPRAERLKKKKKKKKTKKKKKKQTKKKKKKKNLKTNTPLDPVNVANVHVVRKGSWSRLVSTKVYRTRVLRT